MIKNLDASFKTIDTNGDGALSQAELAAAESKGLQRQVASRRARVEAEFTKLDTNKDGALSKAEFMAAAPQRSGDRSQRRRDRRPARQEQGWQGQPPTNIARRLLVRFDKRRHATTTGR